MCCFLAELIILTLLTNIYTSVDIYLIIGRSCGPAGVFVCRLFKIVLSVSTSNWRKKYVNCFCGPCWSVQRQVAHRKGI